MFRALLVVGLVVSLLALGGCKYERVVSHKNLLSGVPGVESSTPSAARTHTKSAIFAVPEGGIRQVDEHGEVTLHSKSFTHLMSHITHAIQNEERELFTEQILSTVTRDEFVERGLDPGLAFDEIKLRERDVFRLFHFLPMGEYTPGTLVKPMGQRTFRIGIYGGDHPELRWVGIDAVFEDGNYRLRWFVNNS